MTNLVDPATIESIVGVPRHPTQHWARAKERDNLGRWHHRVYILHSQACVDSGIDLRDCPYSLALDNGVYYRPIHGIWSWVEDMAVPVQIFHHKDTDWLVPEHAFSQRIQEEKMAQWDRDHE